MTPLATLAFVILPAGIVIFATLFVLHCSKAMGQHPDDCPQLDELVKRFAARRRGVSIHDLIGHSSGNTPAALRRNIQNGPIVPFRSKSK